MGAARIREAIFDRASGMRNDDGSDAWNTKGRVPAGTLQPDDLPFLGVFVMTEKFVPDGDGNAGEPSFIHDAVIGISMAFGMADVENLDEFLQGGGDVLFELLMTDPTFVTFGEGALFESIEGGERQVFYPQGGETRYAELRMALTFRYRTYWSPVIPDDLEKIHVKTAFPFGATAEDQDKVQQVEVEYDLIDYSNIPSVAPELDFSVAGNSQYIPIVY